MTIGFLVLRVLTIFSLAPLGQRVEAFLQFHQVNLSGRICGCFLVEHNTTVGMSSAQCCRYHFHFNKETSDSDPLLQGAFTITQVITEILVHRVIFSAPVRTSALITEK